jgi:hypothetical protein
MGDREKAYAVGRPLRRNVRRGLALELGKPETRHPQ